MKAKEIMTPNPTACTPTSTLADAAKAMWDNDCGILPVVTDGGKVVGLITDRDICMSAGMHGCNLSNLAVEDVISGKVFSVEPETDVQKALETMRDHRVRRLPVVDDNGNLQGMLSMNDVVLKAQEPKDKKAPGITYADVVDALKAICAHQLPIERTHGAGA
jgi:CBS domain-containing protein